MSSTAAPSASGAVRYLPTNEAYDKWAKVYDSDGNFLQALDSLELKMLFPKFLASISTPKPWHVVDLGCGTGRNTALLLDVPGTEILALDASRGMLEVAKRRLSESVSNQGNYTKITFAIFDMLATSEPPASVPLHTVDAIISTLVVEHIPLDTFFPHVAQLLRPGGVLMLTNMHSHMGAISQAGFVDPVTGEKIRPKSYAHTVADVLAKARRVGLEIEGDDGIVERAVDEEMVQALGSRSRKWIAVMCWFGGIFRKVGA